MRLFMTPAGEEAWYSALVRNVRMQITRFEIGSLDVYTLSGTKQGGKTTEQFRAMDYSPDWTPDFNELRANDTIVYEGDVTTMGYWRVSHNDGGLVIRIPANVADMEIGNVRVYAKNTGPYPFATEGAQPYKRYEQVYDNDHGGEVLLFAAFASVADTHWKAETIFPHSLDIRIAMHAEGMFQVLNRNQFAFEGIVSIYEAPTEAYLLQPVADPYGVAVVAAHSKTGRPAVCYRSHGSKHWVGIPLHGNVTGLLDMPKPIADANIDQGLLDHGVLTPPAIAPDTQGVVISTQPRQITLNTLTFTKKDVSSWTAQTAPQTISVLPDTGQGYITTIRVADLAFMGINQQLYFNHNGTRYRLCAQGNAYDTPPLVLRNGDVVYLEGTLQGPISSLTGTIYATLNETPISSDSNNTSTWLVGKVSMHVTSTIIPKPKRLDFGRTGRRIFGYTWDETTPEQYVTGLGFDMYGFPNIAHAVIRVVPTDAQAGGTAMGPGGQMASDSTLNQYLSLDYKDPEGKTLKRRGVMGLPDTALSVLRNGVEVGVISTPLTPEGSVSLTIQENDRISFRVLLDGQPYDPLTLQHEVLAGMAIAVEGIVVESGIKWLDAAFDLATTFGNDVTEPTPGSLPNIPVPDALPQTVGINSFSDMADNYLFHIDHVAVPSNTQPYVGYGPWLTLMAAPNPILSISSLALTVLNVVTTGTITNGLIVELEKFNGWSGNTTTLLINNSTAQTGITLANVHSEDCFRIKVTHKDPNVHVTATLRIPTDAGNKDLLIDSKVRSS